MVEGRIRAFLFRVYVASCVIPACCSLPLTPTIRRIQHAGTKSP